MIRKLEALGVAVTAIVVLGVAVVSTAYAQTGRLTSTGNVTLTGTETGEKANAMTAFGSSIQCPGSTYTGHKYNVTPHTFIPSGAETMTLTPHYKEKNAEGKPNCKTTFGPVSTIDLNGCDYVLHLGTTTTNADQYFASYDLVCPAGKDITVTTWFSEAEHKEGKEACILHLTPGTHMPGGTVTDTTSGDLVLAGSIIGIPAIQTKDNLHSLLCPNKEGTAELDINQTIKGDDEAGGATSISLSHL